MNEKVICHLPAKLTGEVGAGGMGLLLEQEFTSIAKEKINCIYVVPI